MGDLSMWRAIVKTDEVGVDVEQDDGISQLIHVTNVCLGPKPVEGPHTAIINIDGEDVVVATLEAGRCFQHSLDLVLDRSVKLKNTGKSAIHFSGYLTLSQCDGSEQMQEVSSDEDGEDEDYEDEGEEDEEEEEEEEEDKDMDFDLSEEEEGDEPEIMGDSEDEDENEDEEEDEEEEEVEEKEEEEDKKVGKKRTAPTPTTPAPKKAIKVEGGKKVPASAPPKVQQTKTSQSTAEAADVASYMKDIESFLKASGKPETLSALGTAIKRPKGVSKLTTFLKEHKSMFKLDEAAGTVTLA